MPSSCVAAPRQTSAEKSAPKEEVTSRRDPTRCVRLFSAGTDTDRFFLRVSFYQTVGYRTRLDAHGLRARAFVRARLPMRT